MSPSSEPGAAATEAPTPSSPDEHATATVVLPAPLHARPAGRLVAAAAGSECVIEIQHGCKIASPSGILGVMALGADAGATVTVRANGPGATSAIEKIVEILRTME